MFCSRRPLFTTYLGGLLSLTGQNLRVTLAVMTLITVIACFLVTLELRRELGAAAAAVFLVVLYTYYRWYVHSTLTEHLGLGLGVLGFALLVRGVCSQRFPPFVFGVWTLALALNARAGALLVLPAIALWAGRAFGPRRFEIGKVALTSLAIAAAFLASGALAWALGTPAGLFSNFPYHLYGLLTGGDWTSVLRDHPELNGLAEPERVRRIYSLAVLAIQTDPGMPARTAWRAWREFLFTPYSFSFVHNAGVNGALRVLSVVGLMLCWRRRSEALPALLLVMTAGLVASVPFATPWDASWMRAYAATMGLSAAIPAFAISALRTPAHSRASHDSVPELLPAFTWVLTGFVLLAPVAQRLLIRPTLVVAPLFNKCERRAHFRLPAGSDARVVADESSADHWRFELREGDLRRELSDLGALYPGLASEFARAKAPVALLNLGALQK